MRAFTLIEILIAFAVVSILLGIGMVSLGSFRAQADMHRGVQEVLSVLRLAQSKAVASEDASSYGVFFNEGGTFTLFQGSSHETRTVSFDIVYQLPSSVMFFNISFGEGKEVVFSRVTGGAIPGGFFSLQSRTRPLLQETITISETGALSVGGSGDDLNEGRLIDSRHVHIPYQGREIVLSENIVLRFIDSELNEIIEEISVGDYLVNGQVFWEGVVDVGGDPQNVIIQTHALNDPIIATIFSVHRDRSKNTTQLILEINGDATGSLISYNQDGEVTVGTSIYAQEPIKQ